MSSKLEKKVSWEIYLVERAFPNEIFLGGICEAVQGGTGNHIATTNGAVERVIVFVCDLIRGDEQTETAHTDCHAKVLGLVVFDAEVDPSYKHAHGCGPHVEKHTVEQVGVLISLDDQEVAFNIASG